MQSASSYDHQRKKSVRRWAAAKSGYACTAVACVLLFVFVMARVWVPYMRMVDNRYGSQRKAAVYLKSEVCTNAATRSQLEGYNHCESSERIVRQNVYIGAFYDLMETLSICNAERCVFMGFNISAILPRLVMMVALIVAVMFGISVCGFFNASFRYHSGIQTLPMTSFGAENYVPMMVRSGPGDGCRSQLSWAGGDGKAAKFD